MFDLDRINEIFVTLERNKTRSFLTAFGVFWGIFMLVVLMGGGRALSYNMSKNFEGIANNSCSFWSSRTSGAYKGFNKGRWWSIKNSDVAVIKQRVKGIEEIVPITNTWGSSTDNTMRGDKKGSFSVQGTPANYVYVDKQRMKNGRYLNDIDVKEERKVCFIGSQVYEALFNKGEDPIGKEIRVDGIYYKVVGVGEGNSNFSFSGSKEEMITIPVTTMQKVYNLGERISALIVLAKDGFDIAVIQKEIEVILKELHSISPLDKQAVGSFNTKVFFTQFSNLFFWVDMLALIVGFGTLFAGIIGVSNIMMVTVRERTQEIGIRRALGAKPSNIMSQVISESFVITTIAGFLGIAFAVLVLQIVDLGFSTDGGATSVFQIPFYTAVSAAFIIVVLGTLAGLGPAMRAMKIKPIEALRDE